MLYLGLGSSLWVGLLSAILSAVSAALFFRLLLPLGQARAAVGTLALSFTPAVYVASLGALDYIWGLTFFLAATLCVLSKRIFFAAVFLGLAAACRPTYAFAIIPLALLHIGYRPERLRQSVVWRQLAVLAAGSGLIALIFFVPAIVEIGAKVIRMPNSTPPWWLHLAYNGTLGVFGIVGSVAVTSSVVIALMYRRRGIPLPPNIGLPRDGWAFTTVILYALLFLRLPDQAFYLLPALLGLYWLLCRYTPHSVLWAMMALMLVSNFFLRIAYDNQRAVTLALNGPVIQEVLIQDERRCLVDLVKRKLEATPGDFDYVIVGYIMPQFLFEVGAPLSDRILYNVRPDRDGRLVAAETGPINARTRLLLLDRTTTQQSDFSILPEGRAAILDSYQDCPSYQ